MCRVVEDPDLAADPQFARQAGRVERQLELEKLLNERFAERPAAEWVALLREAGVPAGPVNTFGQILADPAVHASGLVRPMEVPVAGPSWTTVFPVRVTDVEPRLDRLGSAPGRADRRGPGRVGRRMTTAAVLAAGTRRLELDRPERANALDAATVERLHAELDRAEREDARLVVLQARGRTFCGGLDLSGLEKETDADPAAPPGPDPAVARASPAARRP